MDIITFGDNQEERAVILHDRRERLCIIFANSLHYLVDAVAVVRTLKADEILMIAPVGAEAYIFSILRSTEYNVYELKK